MMFFMNGPYCYYTYYAPSHWAMVGILRNRLPFLSRLQLGSLFSPRRSVKLMKQSPFPLWDTGIIGFCDYLILWLNGFCDYFADSHSQMSHSILSPYCILWLVLLDSLTIFLRANQWMLFGLLPTNFSEYLQIWPYWYNTKLLGIKSYDFWGGQHYEALRNRTLLS